MISNSLVSLDGADCNMIGTSYPAFRYQTVSLIASVPWNVAHWPYTCLWHITEARNVWLDGGKTSVGLQGGCQQPQGTCLAHQLADYYNADMARIGMGTTPVYFVSRWGGGQPGAQQVCCFLITCL